MAMTATLNGVAAKKDLMTTQSAYIEWVLEKEEWWNL